MKDIPCSQCGKVFKGEKGITLHLKKCRGQAEPECMYCDSKFTRFSNLDLHLTTCLKYQLFKQKEVLHKEYEFKLAEEKSRANLDKQALETLQKYSKPREEALSILQLRLDEASKHQEEMAADFRQQIVFLTKDKEYLHQIIAKLGVVTNKHESVLDPLEEIEDPGYKTAEYVYMIQEREFIKEKRSLYKIGRTTQRPHERFAAYPKGSEEILVMKVRDCKLAERILKDIFSQKFKQDRSIGVEYFEGDLEEMKREFLLFTETTTTTTTTKNTKTNESRGKLKKS
jgi:hypothetical protein